ncbi:MAG TPA: MoaD/ThiS family protein [Dermatophilaceae bacterium]|nr:MoaD/ThiS family protein [Dermatophilaceae bacterium]
MLEAPIGRHDVDYGSARDRGSLRAADGAERTSDPMIAMVTVRYFAAAAEAAGVTTETLPAGSVGDLVASMVRSHGPGLQNVLARCSLLAAGLRVSDDATLLADGVTVDVLPPFAGG